VTAAAAAAAGPATEVTVDVTFEPSSIGDTRAVLLLSSPAGGDYTFPLTGVCLPPKPQVLIVSLSQTALLYYYIHSSIWLFSIHSFLILTPLFSVAWRLGFILVSTDGVALYINVVASR